MFLRRLGQIRSSAACTEALHCPDLLELEDGDFAVIGADITEEAKAALPRPSSCGPTERIVKIPRHLLIAARSDIPEA